MSQVPARTQFPLIPFQDAGLGTVTEVLRTNTALQRPPSRGAQGTSPPWAVTPCLSVLHLAGLQFIFTVAGMGLGFGFVLKTVLIIQGCFIYR